MSNLNSKQIMKTTGSSSNPDLQSWILEFLSEPNKVFDNLPPCPFAKKAWLDGNVEVKKFEGFESLDKDLANWNKEVIIYEFEDTPYLPSFAFALLPVYHDRYPEFIFYDEHPSQVEKVSDVIINSGLSLLIVQKRKELEEARAQLMKTGYYDNWTPELKERIFER
tara:strand:+ start:829 stop:1326 length:498 start_codon:yes stop_codon:yes gene_type:complete